MGRKSGCGRCGRVGPGVCTPTHPHSVGRRSGSRYVFSCGKDLNPHSCSSDMYVRRPLHPMLFNASKGWAVSNGEEGGGASEAAVVSFELASARKVSRGCGPYPLCMSGSRDTLCFPMTVLQITLIWRASPTSFTSATYRTSPLATTRWPGRMAGMLIRWAKP